MLRLLTIVGARPQFIKAAAVDRAIRTHGNGQLCETLLHTGQHYDHNMSARFFDELSLPHPLHNLGLSDTSAEAMAEAIVHTISREHYDAMLVYGDTTSTLAGALAAEAIGMPLLHIEAGLRSHNSNMPEEHNRIATDHRSHLLFAPTARAAQNLRDEGIDPSRVIVNGDVMLDNALFFRHPSVTPPSPFPTHHPIILATVHRNYNADNPQRMSAIATGLRLAAEHLDAEVLLPVHPRVAKAYDLHTLFGSDKRVHLVQPMGYTETLRTIDASSLIATDSGGLQKEAFFYGRPCVVLREETEWQEIVDCGGATLTVCEPSAIAEACISMWNTHPQPSTLFGDGHASETFVDTVLLRLPSVSAPSPHRLAGEEPPNPLPLPTDWRGREYGGETEGRRSGKGDCGRKRVKLT